MSRLERVRRYGLLAMVLILGMTVGARGQEEPSKPADRVLEDLLAAHNKVRAEEKLPPLKLSDKLTQAATAHARDMAEQKRLSHEGSDGSDPKARIKRAGYVYQEIGENVAEGQENVPQVMQTWIDSPPHRDNILGPFTEMGGGVKRGADGQDYWCVDFGRPMPPVDAAKSPGEMIAALNKARARAHKKAVRTDPVLSRVATQFARQAAERQLLTTKDRDGRTPFDVLQEQGYSARRFATTLSSGEGDPAKVVESWMARAGDRDTLLSGFERAGVGVATDSDGTPYWVILLAQGVDR